MTYIAIMAKPQHILKVRRELRRKGHTAYVPAVSRIKPYLKAPKKRHRVTVMLDYVLVKMPAKEVTALWLHDIRSTKNVAGYLKNDGRPSRVSDEEVQSIREEMDKIVRALARKTEKGLLRIGDKARLAKGGLEGKIGTLQWIRGKKAGLEARLLGATRVIEVSIKDLEAA